jgi:hypothetical protein
MIGIAELGIGIPDDQLFARREGYVVVSSLLEARSERFRGHRRRYAFFPIDGVG